MSVWGISSTATAFLHVILLCASSISYEFNSRAARTSDSLQASFSKLTERERELFGDDDEEEIVL